MAFDTACPVPAFGSPSRKSASVLYEEIPQFAPPQVKPP